jgi:biotin carboxyl carrier protein
VKYTLSELGVLDCLNNGNAESFSFTGLDKKSSELAGVSKTWFSDTQLVLEVDGKRTVVHVVKTGSGKVSVSSHLGTLDIEITRGEISSTAGAGRVARNQLKSSMPGKVVKLLCKVGDEVSVGHPLLILEAMKMENEIRSPVSAVIEAVLVETGKSVETGQVLIKFTLKN